MLRSLSLYFHPEGDVLGGSYLFPCCIIPRCCSNFCLPLPLPVGITLQLYPALLPSSQISYCYWSSHKSSTYTALAQIRHCFIHIQTAVPLFHGAIASARHYSVGHLQLICVDLLTQQAQPALGTKPSAALSWEESVWSCDRRNFAWKPLIQLKICWSEAIKVWQYHGSGFVRCLVYFMVHVFPNSFVRLFYVWVRLHSRKENMNILVQMY